MAIVTAESTEILIGENRDLVWVQSPSVSPKNVELAPTPRLEVYKDGALDSELISGEISLELTDNEEGAALAGTTVADAVGGIALFPGLSIDKAGRYRLIASCDDSAFQYPATGLTSDHLWRFNHVNGIPEQNSPGTMLYPDEGTSDLKWGTGWPNAAGYVEGQIEQITSPAGPAVRLLPGYSDPETGWEQGAIRFEGMASSYSGTEFDTGRGPVDLTNGLTFAAIVRIPVADWDVEAIRLDVQGVTYMGSYLGGGYFDVYGNRFPYPDSEMEEQSFQPGDWVVIGGRMEPRGDEDVLQAFWRGTDGVMHWGPEVAMLRSSYAWPTEGPIAIRVFHEWDTPDADHGLALLAVWERALTNEEIETVTVEG